MGTLGPEFEEPAFWDEQAERRIFIKGRTSDAGQEWGICWMRGYTGINTLNIFRSVGFFMEREMTVGHIRRLAKEKGWTEMKRCPQCRILHHSPEKACWRCRRREEEKTG